jgi:hypothetical protein
VKPTLPQIKGQTRMQLTKCSFANFHFSKILNSVNHTKITYDITLSGNDALKACRKKNTASESVPYICTYSASDHPDIAAVAVASAEAFRSRTC